MTEPAPFEASALLDDVRHGFWSRRGGVSAGIYASLNCGPGSGDDPERVDANRARAMAAIGLPGGVLRTAHQIHSADAVAVDGDSWQGARPRVDALVTRTPGVAIGVLTADCGPVLFADPQAGVVGCAHAGWRGAIGGVLEAAVEAMVGLGARRNRIAAVLGPCIGQPSYEVGDDFEAGFLAVNPDYAAFFVPGDRPDKRLFDLPGFILARLQASGIGAVDHVARDTCADHDYFSYRRNCHEGRRDYGRSLAAIALP